MFPNNNQVLPPKSPPINYSQPQNGIGEPTDYDDELKSCEGASNWTEM